MTNQKQRVLEMLTSENGPGWTQLEDLTERTGGDLEETRQALLELQEEELVFLRNGWYGPSAVALSRVCRE